MMTFTEKTNLKKKLYVFHCLSGFVVFGMTSQSV